MAIPIKIFNTKIAEPCSTVSYFPFLKEEDCNKLIEDFVEPEDCEGFTHSLYDKFITIYPVHYGEKSEWLYKDLTDRVSRYNQFGFDFDITSIYGPLQIIEYTEGCFYDWHVDIGAGEAAQRKLSVQIQLSSPDDYEGGESLFKSGPKEHETPKDIGTLSVFPSYVLHKEQMVTSGKRYALSAWALSQRRFR